MLGAGLPAPGGLKKGRLGADPVNHTGRVAAAHLINNMPRLRDGIWEVLLPWCPSRRETRLVN